MHDGVPVAGSYMHVVVGFPLSHIITYNFDMGVWDTSNTRNLEIRRSSSSTDLVDRI